MHCSVDGKWEACGTKILFSPSDCDNFNFSVDGVDQWVKWKKIKAEASKKIRDIDQIPFW